MRLSRKVVLITGASRGIGRAIAERFAREGAFLSLFDLDEFEGNCTLAAIKKEEAGKEAIFNSGDISCSGDVQEVIDKTICAFNRLDVLVNSAGILLLGKDVPAADIEEEIWNRVIAVNLTGTFLTCKYAIPEMIKSGGGSIINLASISAFKGWDLTSAYGASKGGVMTLTRGIAAAYAHFNIRANAICPGNIDTLMIAPLTETPQWKAGIESIPMKRLGRPEEIANMAVFLASDESSYATGAAFILDGGLML